MSTPRRDTGRLHPTVLAFFAGVDVDEAIRVGRANPWMWFSLQTAEARAAREKWIEGDESAALALLARAHYMPAWFLA